MAASSLTRFTVPLQGGGASAQGLLMPKLKYRFRVAFLNFGISQIATELTKQIVDFARPTVDFEEQTIDIYNSKIKYAGKPTWGDCAINLRDDAQGNVSKLIGEQVQKQFDFMEQSSAASGIDYKFTTTCEMLDGGNGAYAPNILEEWQLYGCYIKSVNYNDANYGDNGPMTITVTLGFDNALQYGAGGSGSGTNTGIGQAVGRTIGAVTTG